MTSYPYPRRSFRTRRRASVQASHRRVPDRLSLPGREVVDTGFGALHSCGRAEEGYPPYAVVLDNLSSHKPKEDRWLRAHPNVHFHFTPTHASWLNQIEIWFSILSRQALQGTNFTSVAQLRHAIDEFIKNYNSDAAPFEWTKLAGTSSGRY